MPHVDAEEKKMPEPIAGDRPMPVDVVHRNPTDHDHDEGHHEEAWQEWARVAFVALVTVVVWSGVIPRFHHVDWLAIAGLLIGGFPIFKEAVADVLKGRMTMELSMTIALVAAAAIGEFFTALLIIVFVLVAEILEGMTVGRGRNAIHQLLDLLPHSVEVRSEGDVASRDLAAVQRGRCGAGTSGRACSRGRGCCQRSFVRGSGYDHRGVDAGREDLGLPGFRRNDEPVGRS